MSSGMLEGGHRWIFSDLGNGTPRIDHELELHPKGIFKLMGTIFRSTCAKNVTQRAATLQRRLEAAGRPPTEMADRESRGRS